MKTFQVTIISIIALALSGCATGYYQRGYAGYNTGYSSPSYYRSYERNYYSPGTSFSYGREYVQPSYRYEHRDQEHRYDRHHDRRPAPPPRMNHQGSWNGWQDRGMRQESQPRHQHPQQSQRLGGDTDARHQQMPDRHGYGFRENRDGGGRQHHGRHAE